MKPIMLDANGLIQINDSMSEELKEKIAQYNTYADVNLDEVDYEEIPDGEVETYEDDENLAPNGEELSVSDEELKSLNDLFN